MEQDTETAISVQRELIRNQLTEAGKRRTQGRKEQAEAMVDIRRDIARGHELGLSPSEMAQLSRVTRETVYQIIGPQKKAD